MSQAMVELKNVSKAFGKQTVLNDLSWHIPRGKVIGMLGRNGAGKSTLIECALGLRELDQGSTFILGEASGNISDTVRAKLAYVPQTSELFEWMTGAEMLAYFKTMYFHWNTQKVDTLLRKWEIDPHKRIAKLSVGQKQRLSIIRALAHEPELLILDEPVASLDPLGRREFLNELVSGVLDRETTVVFSTHILSDLERVAMDVAFLRDGKIVLEGELDQLLETVYKIEGKPDDLAQLATDMAQGLACINSSVNQGQIILKMSNESVLHLRAKHPELNIRNMNLEDLFIEVTQ